jgi:hypothetical protein
MLAVAGVNSAGNNVLRKLSHVIANRKYTLRRHQAKATLGGSCLCIHDRMRSMENLHILEVHTTCLFYN